jgi:hypothetical protein
MSDISRTTVSIRLFDKELDPEYVTQKLGCKPTAAAKTGEKLVLPSGKERIIKRGYWRLEYGDNEERILEEKIKLLFASMTDDLEAWHEVTRTAQVADIFCGLFIDTWNEGFTLSQSTLRMISERNLKIGFDIYSPTDTWYGENEESEASETS